MMAIVAHRQPVRAASAKKRFAADDEPWPRTLGQAYVRRQECKKRTAADGGFPSAA